MYQLELFEFNHNLGEKQQQFCKEYKDLCTRVLEIYIGKTDFHDWPSAIRYNEQQLVSLTTK